MLLAASTKVHDWKIWRTVNEGALVAAAGHGHVEIVKKLLKTSGNINAISSSCLKAIEAAD